MQMRLGFFSPNFSFIAFLFCVVFVVMALVSLWSLHISGFPFGILPGLPDDFTIPSWILLLFVASFDVRGLIRGGPELIGHVGHLGGMISFIFETHKRCHSSTENETSVNLSLSNVECECLAPNFYFHGPHFIETVKSVQPGRTHNIDPDRNGQLCHMIRKRPITRL